MNLPISIWKMSIHRGAIGNQLLLLRGRICFFQGDSSSRLLFSYEQPKRLCNNLHMHLYLCGVCVCVCDLYVHLTNVKEAVTLRKMGNAHGGSWSRGREMRTWFKYSTHVRNSEKKTQNLIQKILTTNTSKIKCEG